MHQHGFGVDQNLETSQELIEMGIKLDQNQQRQKYQQSIGMSYYYLGLSLEKQSPNESYSLIRESALRGNQEALIKYAKQLIEQNLIAKALKLVEESPNQSDELVVFYYTTLLLTDDIDPSEIKSKLIQLNNQLNEGNSELLHYLGYISEIGFDQNPNYQEASSYYEKAVNLGYAKSMCSLAKFYAFGYLGQVELDKAEILYRNAIDLGDINALTELGLIGLEDGIIDIDEALTLLFKAAELGSAGALGILGKLFLDGEYVKQDTFFASSLLTQGAAGGDEYAIDTCEDLGLTIY
jgi:TPR repeat protein